MKEYERTMFFFLQVRRQGFWSHFGHISHLIFLSLNFIIYKIKRKISNTSKFWYVKKMSNPLIVMQMIV